MRSLLLSITVDFDKSAFIQVVLFAGLILVLKPLLFDPMLALFAAREASTLGAWADARSLQERAAELLTQYEEHVGEARGRAHALRDQSRRETSALEAEILKQGRQEADALFAAGLVRIENELSTIERDLEGNRPELVRQIGARILGREVGS